MINFVQNDSEIKKIEFAELLGVHRSRISQLDKLGQLVLSADGKLVNVLKSLELIIKRSTIDKTVAQARHAKSRFLKGGSGKTTAEIAKEHLKKNSISTKQNIVPTKQKDAATKQNIDSEIVEAFESEEENSPAKQISTKQNAAPAKQIEPETKQNTTDDISSVTVDNATDEYNIARAKNEIRKGEQMDIEIALSKNELVDRQMIMSMFVTVVANVRTNLERWPDRMSPLLVGETDQAKIFRLIQDEVESGLISLHQEVDNLIEKIDE